LILAGICFILEFAQNSLPRIHNCLPSQPCSIRPKRGVVWARIRSTLHLFPS
jgi:hypothetical protein